MMQKYEATVEIVRDYGDWIKARELFNGHWRHVNIAVPDTIKRNSRFDPYDQLDLRVQYQPMGEAYTHKLLSLPGFG